MTIFTTLLSRSWNFLRQFKVPLGIGALLFTALMLLSEGFFAQQEDRVTREMMLRLGIEDSRFEELDQRMQEGDQAAFDEMLEEMEMVGTMFEEMTEDAQLEFLMDWSKKMTFSMLPMTFIMFLMSMLIYIVSSAFYYVVIIQEIRDPLVALKASLSKILPLAGVSIWMMLRSFMWVPGLNIFTGIYYLPRMMFSGVFLVRENLGIIESVNASLERTKGKWFSVLTQYIMLFVVLFIASAIFSMVARFTGPLDGFLMTYFGQALFAFALVFTVFFSQQFTPLRRKPSVKVGG